MSLHIPNFAGSIMTRTEHQVPSLGEEFNSLNSFIVTAPSVQPFLGNEAVMLFLSQVAWCLDEALAGSRVHILSITVINGGGLVN
jgi:hypothetical protein